MSSESDTSYLTTNYEYDSWMRAVRTTDSTGYNSGTITYDLNYADRNPYTAAGGKWENGITLISSYSSMPNENDFNIEIGGALYLLIGADFNFSFNLSNFARELGLI